MSWEDFKAGAKAKYQQCKTFVKEEMDDSLHTS